MRASHRVTQTGWSLARGFCAPRARKSTDTRAHTAPNAR